jgi:copper chaperone
MAKQITVEGMSCGGCEQNVENTLGDLPDVTSVEADNESDTVTVEGDASEDDIAAAVEDAGYTPKV